ncbi:MAG TPA: hypothetical protein VEJ89_06685, partial [Myxococcaceae bacterium]|nr:hypothetical protein [Myxococcaceae bacterium]
MLRRLVILLVGLAVASCSSGGGSAGGPNPTTPVANAGPIQVVSEGQPYTLDASGSSDPSGLPLSYL